MDTHPSGWNPSTHYGMCGQSCPCCRSFVGDILGACPVCDRLKTKENVTIVTNTHSMITRSKNK